MCAMSADDLRINQWCSDNTDDLGSVFSEAHCSTNTAGGYNGHGQGSGTIFTAAINMRNLIAYKDGCHAPNEPNKSSLAHNLQLQVGPMPAGGATCAKRKSL